MTEPIPQSELKRLLAQLEDSEEQIDLLDDETLVRLVRVAQKIEQRAFTALAERHHGLDPGS